MPSAIFSEMSRSRSRVSLLFLWPCACRQAQRERAAAQAAQKLARLGLVAGAPGGGARTKQAGGPLGGAKQGTHRAGGRPIRQRKTHVLGLEATLALALTAPLLADLLSFAPLLAVPVALALDLRGEGRAPPSQHSANNTPSS